MSRIALALICLAAGALIHRFSQPLKNLVYPPRVVTLVGTARYRAAVELFESSTARADIVMLGDSNTEFGLWSEWLGRPVLNRGISGDDTGGALARLDEIERRRPRLVYLQIGENDATYGEPLARTKTNLEVIVTRLQRVGARVVMLTVPFVGRGTGPNVNAQIKQINAEIRGIAARRHAELIDLNAMTASHEELADRYTFDGIHFNAAGFAVWRSALHP